MVDENENETKPKETRIDFSEEPVKTRKSMGISTYTFRPLRLGSALHNWTDISKINYLSTLNCSEYQAESCSTLLLPKNMTNADFDNVIKDSNNDSMMSETCLVKVTSLLNEDQLWGCFYNFPCLYEDSYSPVVRIRNVEDVPKLEAGVLTRDMVTACLSYLKRTPILGDYVYIKLDLSAKHLTNINVLQHYKYIVYLDLSSNLITDITVLSKLLYLQYLSVCYNRLRSVLDYETPQWFLTEVHYKYNSVQAIRDLSALWSITVLDLSHNNIKEISGLQTLRYLRHLDLSFNHIRRLENLNHLRLLWLDVSYNSLSSFEFGPDAGLWTLLHLEYLNLNENNLTSMKIFTGCTRLRELHAKNNRLSKLMELAVYMRKLRRLMYMDLRSNPVCSVPGYKDVVINTFSNLLHLDGRDLDPVEKASSLMYVSPDAAVFSLRRLLRLLYVQQLSRSRVSPYVPPADTTDVPIVVLVGYEAVGKGNLARRLASECSSKIELALQHTTAFYHYANHYKLITRQNFDAMLLAGDFLTYSEMDGESYGLSREEAYVRDGKVRLATMDLYGALMLKLRGYRPFMILANCLDKETLAFQQKERKEARDLANEKQLFTIADPREVSTLQVLLSGRIIIHGILNEILQLFPDDKEKSEFTFDSECSLMMDSETRRNQDFKYINRIAFSISSSSLEDKTDFKKSSAIDSGLYSLYKDIPGTEFISRVFGTASYQEREKSKKSVGRSLIINKQDQTNVPGRKSIDFSKSSTWKGYPLSDSRKSSKSVTFTSPVNNLFVEPSTSANIAEPQNETEMANLLMKSMSAKMVQSRENVRAQSSDLWLAFLIQNGLPLNAKANELYNKNRREAKTDSPEYVEHQLDEYQTVPAESFTAHLQDDYEEIHRNNPGLFYDTVTMDNPDDAFHKMKRLVKNIVNSQLHFTPMMDLDIANSNCPIVKKKLENIRSQIAPQRVFY
ncbi:uncharacterized protein LOC112056183 [Bicyclus anynana]|uniref:Dynein axonemal assembly factor 1 homolog n=1 Tax=Bicyclus anynana TaxID=110368 RepID=A0ABM3LWW4_BICAN|nr:uncharacterized protein LOC112056183 [Bicyclus anynana]